MCVFECHGTYEVLLRTLKISLRSHVLFHSPCRDGGGPVSGTGGVALLVARNLVPGSVNLSLAHAQGTAPAIEITPGRLVLLKLDGGESVRSFSGYFVIGNDES